MGNILLLHPPFMPFAIVTPVTASYRLLLHHLLTICYLSFSSILSSSPLPSHCAPQYSLEVSSSCLSLLRWLSGDLFRLCAACCPLVFFSLLRTWRLLGRHRCTCHHRVGVQNAAFPFTSTFSSRWAFLPLSPVPYLC